MLIDITFFDDAVPTSTLTRPSGLEAAAAITGAEDEERGIDVTDLASAVASLRMKLTKPVSFRCVAFYTAFSIAGQTTCILYFLGCKTINWFTAKCPLLS